MKMKKPKSHLDIWEDYLREEVMQVLAHGNRLRYDQKRNYEARTTEEKESERLQRLYSNEIKESTC